MTWLGRKVHSRTPVKPRSDDLAVMVLGQLREDPAGLRQRLEWALSVILSPRPVILQTTKTTGFKRLAALFGFRHFDPVIVEVWWVGDASIYELSAEDWQNRTIIVERPPYQSLTRFRRERWQRFVRQLEGMTGRSPEIHRKGHLIFR